MPDYGNYPQPPPMTLEAGTTLYHGTDSAGDFLIPDGPAWFCLDKEKALEWTGWSEGPCKGRKKGEPRVLAVTLAKNVTLLDTTSRVVWIALCHRFDFDDAQNYELAHKLKEKGYAGWYGPTEVLLCRPDECCLPGEPAQPTRRKQRGRRKEA